MKRMIFLLGLILVIWLAAGCVVVGSRKGCPEHHEGETVIYPSHSETIAEIDAAGELFSESNKRDMYKTLAVRQGMTGEEQAYLVAAVFGKLFSESSKKEVLLTLIKNPEFTCSAKGAILANINNLFSESNKKSVLVAINNRGPCLDDSAEAEVIIEATPAD